MSEYLRKRFEERIWDSRLMDRISLLIEDPEEIEPLVQGLVEGLLTEVGDD